MGTRRPASVPAFELPTAVHGPLAQLRVQAGPRNKPSIAPAQSFAVVTILLQFASGCSVCVWRQLRLLQGFRGSGRPTLARERHIHAYRARMAPEREVIMTLPADEVPWCRTCGPG